MKNNEIPSSDMKLLSLKAPTPHKINAVIEKDVLFQGILFYYGIYPDIMPYSAEFIRLPAYSSSCCCEFDKAS